MEKTQTESIFRLSASFPNELAVISARDQLVRMGFTITVHPHSPDDASWRCSGKIVLNGKNKTRDRVLNVLTILIDGLDGTYIEESEKD